jgi:hypothetical protein
MYIADTHVTYRVENDNKDLIDNFIKHINSFKYIDDSMKKEFQRYMPKLKSKIQTNDFTYLIIEKTEDVISLKDVLEYYKGKLNPKDVAWIISSLSNLACYLKFTNKVHCNLDLNSCFVSPKYHSICILGGWWYTTNHGDKFHALPSRSIDYGNHYLLDTKLSDYSLDLDMIKITAKELLGDISGSKLLMDKTIPKSLVQWLKTSSSNKPVDEYKNWSSKVLKDSFGERKFHEMNLTSKMIYEMHE